MIQFDRFNSLLIGTNMEHMCIIQRRHLSLSFVLKLSCLLFFSFLICHRGRRTCCVLNVKLFNAFTGWRRNVATLLENHKPLTPKNYFFFSLFCLGFSVAIPRRSSVSFPLLFRFFFCLLVCSLVGRLVHLLAALPRDQLFGLFC